MKYTLILLTALLLLALPAFSAGDKSTQIDVGVGIVDITPTEEIVLAGSPSPKKTAEVKSRLFVRALVLSANRKKGAIVTLDTLKYPVHLVQEARTRIEQTTGIPASDVIICAPHTHRGPLWSYYPDHLVTSIADAVALAASDHVPCTVGAAHGRVEGVSQCRRVIKEGHAWNVWQLKPDEVGKYPEEDEADPDFDVLALKSEDGKFKAILHNFACHPTSSPQPLISADYPGDTEKRVQEQIGYEVPALFLTGACGDVNPTSIARSDLFGEKLGDEIVRCLGQLAPIANPTLTIENREFKMPGRENPEFKEEEITRNWPAQLEHYRKAFDVMKERAQPTYPYFMTGIRIGEDFAIVTNANEIFCRIGVNIKSQSPFKYTMVAEQTNGAHGYVPTAKAFEGCSYETWFGEHSYLTTKAAEIIERQSVDILNKLKNKP